MQQALYAVMLAGLCVSGCADLLGLSSTTLVQDPDALIFDAGTDASPCEMGNDEDGDSVNDACDLCPAVFDGQLDTDADGVGDACDPDELSAQRLALFDPFLNQTSAWTYDASVVIADGIASFNAETGFASLRLHEPPGNDWYSTSGSSTGPTNSGRQIAMYFVQQPGPGIHYCELFENDAGLSLRYSFTLNLVDYAAIEIAPIDDTLTNATFALQAMRTSSTVTCRAEVNGNTYTVMGGIPPVLVNNTQFWLVAQNLNVAFANFVRLTSP